MTSSNQPGGGRSLPLRRGKGSRHLAAATAAAQALAAAGCLAFWPAVAWAQAREDLARCRAIAEDARRLACYDAIQLSPSAPRSKYEPVALADLQGYALSYRGRLIDVTGWIRPERDFYLLGATAQDAKPLPVDVRVLGRRERDQLAQQCPAGCEASIQGRVGPVNFVTGIVAETVLVR